MLTILIPSLTFMTPISPPTWRPSPPPHLDRQSLSTQHLPLAHRKPPLHRMPHNLVQLILLPLKRLQLHLEFPQPLQVLKRAPPTRLIPLHLPPSIQDPPIRSHARDIRPAPIRRNRERRIILHAPPITPA